MGLNDKLKNAEDKVTKAGAAVGAVAAIYKLTVKVEGKPLLERDKPATVRVLGIPVFVRDENLDRIWFGVLNRGKSQVAKDAIAKREGGNVK